MSEGGGTLRSGTAVGNLACLGLVLQAARVAFDAFDRGTTKVPLQRMAGESTFRTPRDILVEDLQRPHRAARQRRGTFGVDGDPEQPCCSEEPMDSHRVFKMSFASVYPHYLQKAEKKGRTKAELDEVICWLTGYSSKELARLIVQQRDFETFFSGAPSLHPNATKITGVICGVRIEEIEHPLMRKIRYLDKLVDELAKGRPMEKILRK